jgi:hypothetical protein
VSVRVASSKLVRYRIVARILAKVVDGVASNSSSASRSIMLALSEAPRSARATWRPFRIGPHVVNSVNHRPGCALPARWRSIAAKIGSGSAVAAVNKLVFGMARVLAPARAPSAARRVVWPSAGMTPPLAEIMRSTMG